MNKIDKFHHHEALHAAHIATDFVSDHVLDHVWISSNPDLKEKAEAIVSDLYGLYKDISAQD